MKLVYDYFTNNLPTDLTSLFSLSSEVHTTNLDLNSARNNVIHISKMNTETYGNKNGIVTNSDPHRNLSVTDIRSHHLKRILKKQFV